MAITVDKLPSMGIVKLVGNIDKTTVNPIVIISPISVVKTQVDNTPGNDTLLTEISLTISAKEMLDDGSERMYLTGGVVDPNDSNNAKYTATVRGLFNTNKTNPPVEATDSGDRNYRNHSNGARCIVDETWLTRELKDTFDAGTVVTTATAGENLTVLQSVSLEAAGLFKYNSSTRPNLVGIVNATVTSGNSATYTTYGGVSTGHSGLTIGEDVFAENTGVVNQTGSATTKILGTAETAANVRIAKAAVIGAMTKAQAEDGTDATQVSTSGVRLAQAKQSNLATHAVDSAGSDTYVITLTPALTALSDGQEFVFEAGTANTGAATLNIDTLGAKAIVKNFNVVLEDNDILAGQKITVCYDSTNDKFQITSPSASAATTSALGRRGTVYSTMFEIAGRFGTDIVSGTATFNTNGVVLDTTATANRRAGVFFAAGDNANNKLFIADTAASFDVTPANVSVDNDGGFVGWHNAATLSNGLINNWVADTSTTEHIGFIFLRVSGALNLYAGTADGSGNTATLMQTFVNGTKLSLEFVVRSGAVDFFINQTLTTTVTTDIPTSMSTAQNMFFSASNDTSSGTQTTLTIHAHSLRKT